MLEEEPTPASGVHPSPFPPGPFLGETVGGLWLSLPVHGLTPGPFPQHGSSSPQPGNPTSHCPPPKRLGGAKVGQGSDPGRKGPLLPTGERCEHPGLLAPAAVMGNPYPIYFSTSFLPSSLSSPPTPWFCVCVCVSTVPFLFYSCFPFSQRNKGLEIAGPLVLVQ